MLEASKLNLKSTALLCLKLKGVKKVRSVCKLCFKFTLLILQNYLSTYQQLSSPMCTLVVSQSNVNIYVYNVIKQNSSVKKQTSCTSLDTVNERTQALALLDAGLSVKDVDKQMSKSERLVTKWRRRRQQNKQ